MEVNEAIENSILKWGVLATTGEFEKYIGGITTRDMPNGCALCQLAGQRQFDSISRYRCRKYCPYAQKFGCCCNKNSPFAKWEGVRSNLATAIERRKHFASEFLEQLKQLNKD